VTGVDVSSVYACFEAKVEKSVAEVRPGRRGTLRPCLDENSPMYYEDTGEPILDAPMTGTAFTLWQNGRKQDRCIHPDAETLAEW